MIERLESDFTKEGAANARPEVQKMEKRPFA